MWASALQVLGYRVQRMPRSWLLSTWGLLIHMLVNIFQVQIILSHQLFLQVSKTITRLHLTMTQGQIWGLFSCVEKLKYQTLPIAPHAPACGDNRLSNALGGCSGLFFKHWMGRITTQGRDNGGSEGLLTPSFLWKEASTWQLPIWSHLLKPTEKSLSYNQRFPEIAQEPKAMRRKRF